MSLAEVQEKASYYRRDSVILDIKYFGGETSCFNISLIGKALL